MKTNFATFAQNFSYMRIDILTLFPALFEGPFTTSIIKRSVEKGLVDIHLHNIRNFSKDKHKRVDDEAYSSIAGMVMTIQPIADAIEYLQSQRKYDEVIYVTPDGEQLKQGICNTMSSYENIIILCGHYKGIDQRIRDNYITKEISIGDYVLTGGELAACVLVDSIVRLIPDVISDETSALTDSFQDNLLSPPIYTRPYEYNGWKVPDILLSGDDKKIADWQLQKALERTKQRRPDLLED